MDVVVTGIGLISALGNLESSWRSLLKNKSGIGQYQPFPDLPSLPLGMIHQVPTDLETLTQLVVADAIEDANLEIPIADCGVVIGSSRGCQASWEKLARRLIAEKLQINSPLPTPVRTSVSSVEPLTLTAEAHSPFPQS